MNRTDFCKKFAKKMEIDPKEAKATCLAMFELLAECINEEDRVYIKDFGTFKKKHCPAKKIGNPHTGQPMILPEHTKVTFSSSVGFLDDQD